MQNSILMLLQDKRFQSLPMPAHDGPEPSEFEIFRIKRYMQDGRFCELSSEAQRWVCHRLMPSMARYGVYPPPNNGKEVCP